jgi:hypothetical protein
MSEKLNMLLLESVHVRHCSCAQGWPDTKCQALRKNIQVTIADTVAKAEQAESKIKEAMPYLEELEYIYESMGCEENLLINVQELQLRTVKAESRVTELAGQVAGSQALADEKCKGFLLRSIEAEKSAEAMSEKVKSLAPHGSCACSYDKPGDVCMHHSPQLVKAEQRLARVRRFIEEREHAEICSFWYSGRPCDCWKSALKELEEK